jgi:1,4-alpha-glucan branching enzyme
LAEPDTVSLADSFKNNVVAFFSHSEVIAGNGAPTQLMEEKANGPAHKSAIRASAAILIWTIRR